MKNFFEAHKGVIFLCTAVAIFSVQNIVTRYMSGSFSTHQILFIRALIMMPVILVIAYQLSELRSLRTRNLHIHMLFSLSLFGAFSGFFIGLSALPMANSIAIFFAAPLFVTLLSVFVLKESIGIHRISALILGFLGVLVIVRPGIGDFNYATLFPLAGAFSYAFMPILARTHSTTESVSAMIFYNAFFSTVYAGIVGIFLGAGAFTVGTLGDPLFFLTRPWSLPEGTEWLIFGFIGLTSAVGSYFATQAYRTTRASIVTPFEYTSLLWATLWGFLFWNEVPDAPTLIGMLMVVVSGLYIVVRETYLKRLDAKGKIVGNG